MFRWFKKKKDNHFSEETIQKIKTRVGSELSEIFIKNLDILGEKEKVVDLLYKSFILYELKGYENFFNYYIQKHHLPILGDDTGYPPSVSLVVVYFPKTRFERISDYNVYLNMQYESENVISNMVKDIFWFKSNYINVSKEISEKESS